MVFTLLRLVVVDAESSIANSSIIFSSENVIPKCRHLEHQWNKTVTFAMKLIVLFDFILSTHHNSIIRITSRSGR